MLLEFKVSNFKSFKDEMVFSMIPAPKIRDISYSILKKKVGSKEYKALSTAIIYGPNAAGKTNIIGAIEFLKEIILKGKIDFTQFNAEQQKQTANPVLNHIELVANINNSESEPLTFSIKFIHKNILFEYHLKIIIGIFADSNQQRKISFEALTVNNKKIFERKDTVNITNIDSIELNPKTDRDASANMANNVAEDELFISTYFKVLYSAEIVDIIHEWFSSKLSIIYSSDKMQFMPNLTGLPEKTLLVDKYHENAAKIFGIGGSRIGYAKDEQSDKPLCLSMITRLFDNRTIIIPSSFFESLGTLRFMNIFPLIIHALNSGSTLVIDEFDASIHPMALMSIINAFHNDEINVNGAQLIFNTHNPIFLNRNLLRRDEIKFVEKDEETGNSIHYSLSDFGTTGKKSVRNRTDYMKNYFISQYGAIRNIDFSDIIIDAMKENHK